MGVNIVIFFYEENNDIISGPQRLKYTTIYFEILLTV